MLGLRRDLLGVDRVASTRARAFASSSRARSSAPSWSRTSTSRRSRARGSLAIGPRLSRALVFWAISRAAVSRDLVSVARRLLADETVELGGQLVDPADVGFLAAEQSLGRGKVVEPEGPELRAVSAST